MGSDMLILSAGQVFESVISWIRTYIVNGIKTFMLSVEDTCILKCQQDQKYDTV